MASLLTYKNQVSQDGVIRDDKALPGLELRVAVMPTINGERVTIRVLDANSAPLYLEQLGFTGEVTEKIKAMLARPSGMIILTGPSGCGKTTTIYAMVRELVRNNQDPASIITVEDPVERRVDGVSQVSLSRPDSEWDYARALRAALRQDVKTLVIGEMRDREVIKTALDAALTGHRVITTFHAGDAASVYARILHHGFEPFLAAAAITGIISQRLLPATAGGRVPVTAVLAPDDAWRDFIMSGPGLEAARRRAEETPGAGLLAAAKQLAVKGVIREEDTALI
jgi:type II secretory ATPase GspE/PulE/Tfp pilus assembly ATPase PilB-like protein